MQVAHRPLVRCDVCSFFVPLPNQFRLRLGCSSRPLRERAVHPTPATTPAFCPPLQQPPALAELIGELVAVAAIVIGQAVGEYASGGLTTKTKLRGATWLRDTTPWCRVQQES